MRQADRWRTDEDLIPRKRPQFRAILWPAQIHDSGASPEIGSGGPPPASVFMQPNGLVKAFLFGVCGQAETHQAPAFQHSAMKNRQPGTWPATALPLTRNAHPNSATGPIT